MTVADVRVSAEQLASYQRDGAVVLRGILSPDRIQLLERGIEEAFVASKERPGAVTQRIDGGETVVYDYATNESPTLRILVKSGIVGEIARSLMQTESAQVILDQVFYKTRGAIAPTPWHQDTPFLRVRGDQLIRLWFPCDFSPKALTVQVVRGSHRWNVVYGAGPAEFDMAAGESGVGDSWLPPPPDVRRYRESFDVMSWDVAPGDVLAFQGNMLHGSDGHPGHDTPRRAFAILLGGPELRYHKPDGKAFPSPGRRQGSCEADDLPHGAPIGRYVEAFPPC